MWLPLASVREATRPYSALQRQSVRSAAGAWAAGRRLRGGQREWSETRDEGRGGGGGAQRWDAPKVAAHKDEKPNEDEKANNVTPASHRRRSVA